MKEYVVVLKGLSNGKEYCPMPESLSKIFHAKTKKEAQKMLCTYEYAWCCRELLPDLEIIEETRGK